MANVTPYAGVWIEIYSSLSVITISLSLPTRECGLKFITGASEAYEEGVTPYAGVWIEIIMRN